MFKKLGVISVLSIAMAGCTHATYYAKSVSTQSYMSRSISLDEVPDSAKTVYITFDNHSNLSESYIRKNVLQNLKEKGYRLEHNPAYAHFIMHVDLEKVLRVTEGVAMDIGRSPYKTPLDTVPLNKDGKYGYYVGVADIKLVVKNVYAKNARSIYKSRLVAFPSKPNLKEYYSKPAIAYTIAQKINAIFDLKD